PTRSGTLAPSPVRPDDPKTPAVHPCATSPGRPSGIFAPVTDTDLPQTSPPSTPHGSNTLATPRIPQYRSLPPPPLRTAPHLYLTRISGYFQKADPTAPGFPPSPSPPGTAACRSSSPTARNDYIPHTPCRSQGSAPPSPPPAARRQILHTAVAASALLRPARTSSATARSSRSLRPSSAAGPCPKSPLPYKPATSPPSPATYTTPYCPDPPIVSTPIQSFGTPQYRSPTSIHRHSPIYCHDRSAPPWDFQSTLKYTPHTPHLLCRAPATPLPPLPSPPAAGPTPLPPPYSRPIHRYNLTASPTPASPCR